MSLLEAQAVWLFAIVSTGDKIIMPEGVLRHTSNNGSIDERWSGNWLCHSFPTELGY